jgi:hypothetical protein
MSANQLRADIGESRSSQQLPDDSRLATGILRLSASAEKQKRPRSKNPEPQKPRGFLSRKKS